MLLVKIISRLWQNTKSNLKGGGASYFFCLKILKGGNEHCVSPCLEARVFNVHDRYGTNYAKIWTK